MTRSIRLFPLLLPALLAGAASAAPYVMQGVVRDAAGRPLAGVRVGADNTYFDGTELWTVTDPQGRYRLDLKGTMGAWQPVARLKRVYHGETFDLALQADNDAPFGGKDGATRNFTLLVSGKSRQGGLYGARFYAQMGFSSDGDIVDNDDLVVTLTPRGPLLDGSPGKTLSFRYREAPLDVPLGRYAVTARLASGDRPVFVRARGGSYAPSAVVDVQYVAGTGHVLSVDVIHPRK